MSWYSPKYGSLNPNAPKPWGVCARCGFWVDLDAMQFQTIYGGAHLIRTNILVCPECFDEPNEQTRSYVIPPDPLPVRNARPPGDYVGPDRWLLWCGEWADRGVWRDTSAWEDE
jgi:hypothetical protein